MFHHIVVPLDLVDHHSKTIDTALNLAKQFDGEVILVHVIELISGMAKEEARDFYGRIEERAGEFLKEVGVSFQEAGVRWRHDVVFGKTAVEIAQFAERMHADLILLSSHRFDPEIEGSGWATSSFRVGILSPCSTLLIK